MLSPGYDLTLWLVYSVRSHEEDGGLCKLSTTRVFDKVRPSEEGGGLCHLGTTGLLVKKAMSSVPLAKPFGLVYRVRPSEEGDEFRPEAGTTQSMSNDIAAPCLTFSEGLFKMKVARINLCFR